MKLPPLNALRIFEAVARLQSFTKAADTLYLTQSAVSKQVAALERALGARLLSRTTRSLALTEEGQRYFEQARRLVAEIAEARGFVAGGGRACAHGVVLIHRCPGPRRVAAHGSAIGPRSAIRLR